MKAYPEYKKTEQLWIPLAPVNWEIIKIKYLFQERVEKGFPNETLLVSSQNMGVVPKAVYGNRTVEAQKDLHLLKLLRKGDFVISLRSFQGGIEYAYYQGIISPAYTIMVNNGLVISNYFKYLAKSQRFIELLQMCVTGIREGQNIDYKKLKNHYIPVPPRNEQDRIVRFLDWKVSEINRLINVQKKFISIVAEQKEKIICDALLHGINNDVSYKNTGISWLSSIPSHWKVIKIKWLFDEADERNTDKNAELLTFSKKKGLIPFSEASDKLPSANDLSNYKIIHKGQLLENRMQAWHGMFICADKEGCVSPDYSVFSASKERELNVKFYEYVFRCHIWVEQFANASRGVGSGFNRLYTPQFGAIYTIYPEVSEQNQIVAYLDEQMQKIEAAIANKQKQIEILQELKTRLISDVVTGKIDVRGVEIPDYEYVEEESDMENTDVEDEASDEEATEQEDQ